MASTVYPTGLTVQSVYNAYGALSQLKNATTGASYWTATSVDGRGNVTGDSLGNGITESRTYDPVTGFLTGIASSSASAGAIQQLTYAFDTLGNLQSRADGKQAISEAFVYDSFRLRYCFAT